MRGGTANCSVSLAADPIGSPLITAPDVLIAMNQPSLDKFIDAVVPGGLIIADSTLVQSIPERSDVTVKAVPAADIAEKAGLKGLGNIVLVGALFAADPFCDRRGALGGDREVRSRAQSCDARQEQAGPRPRHRGVRAVCAARGAKGTPFAATS